MTKAEARKLIRAHIKKLDSDLEAAQSQFQVRMCYVNAHDELHDIAKRIAEKLEGEPFCEDCAEHYADCTSPGPHMEDEYEYAEFTGVLFAKPK